MMQRVGVCLVALSLVTSSASLALGLARGLEREKPDQVCIYSYIKLAQATADLARTEGDLRELDPDAECDLACSALERHRDILMSEIRDEYKVLREHRCKELAHE